MGIYDDTPDASSVNRLKCCWMICSCPSRIGVNFLVLHEIPAPFAASAAFGFDKRSVFDLDGVRMCGRFTLTADLKKVADRSGPFPLSFSTLLAGAAVGILQAFAM